MRVRLYVWRVSCVCSLALKSGMSAVGAAAAAAAAVPGAFLVVNISKFVLDMEPRIYGCEWRVCHLLCFMG